ncbi:TetR family transcriptional regulator [Alsobacter soli]|uniref:TetR family transcriptional regulator n=1 Tax=Alsobacter soli TaxID=2109933 RepID=A0A2T1HUL9_9HYPH|nr:TetR/AcrR family transcriptional regulator [Alsobacter soli]PSC05363.1 TetR family transcriptional regulator [Alsobacter soli]
MGLTCPSKSRPRDRILDAARDMFRKFGIKGCGVDSIAEAAGTNKMTLYRHFGSKDELVAECLRDQARAVADKWAEFDAAYPDDPLSQLRAWVKMSATCDSRGCDLANAAIELPDEDHPARKVVEDFKRSQRDRLAGLCRRVGARDPEMLADTLSLLVEGARVSRQSVGPEGPCARFQRVAEAAIEASIGAA